MNFEVFANTGGRRPRSASILLTPDGRYLRLNVAALRLLGDRRSVALAAERESGRIMLTPDDTEAAFRVNSAGHVSARQFAKHFGLVAGSRWSVIVDGGSLVGTPAGGES